MTGSQRAVLWVVTALLCVSLYDSSVLRRAALQGARKKVLAVLPVAGSFAKNPGHISCVENELGLRDWLEERNCEYVVTAGRDLHHAALARAPHAQRCISSGAAAPGWACYRGGARGNK